MFLAKGSKKIFRAYQRGNLLVLITFLTIFGQKIAFFSHFYAKFDQKIALFIYKKFFDRCSPLTDFEITPLSKIVFLSFFRI